MPEGLGVAVAVLFNARHPFRVVDRATGHTVRRFSNLRAAIDSAQMSWERYARGLDVVAEGEIVARSGLDVIAEGEVVAHWGPGEGESDDEPDVE